jgi:hypothetical protein
MRKDGKKHPSQGSTVCHCRGGDILRNPDPHCPTCGGQESRRF